MENKVNDFYETKFEEIQNEKLQNNTKKTTKKTNKRGLKALIIASLALLLAGVTALTCFLVSRKKKYTTNATTSMTSSIVTVDDLGMEEEFTSSESKQYGKTTGDVDVNEIVEKDGTIWKNQEAADKSDEVGKVEIDTKNDTLVVKPNGEVHEKEEEYVIKKEDGKKETLTKKEFDDKYVYDKELDTTVVKEDANKFVELDSNYYNKTTGDLVYKKGERVLKATYEKIKKDSKLTTKKPVKSSTVSSKPSNTTSNTTSSKPSNTTSSTTSSKPSTTTSNTSSTTSVTDSLGGVVNEDGTYTIYFESEDGKIPVTYMDKATYQSWLLDENAEENFGQYLDGIIYPKSVIDEMYSQKIKTK